MNQGKDRLINLGTRNKGTFWEYLSAYSFLYAWFPGSKFSFKFFAGIGKGIANKHCHSKGDIERNIQIFIKEFEKGLYNRSYFKKLMDSYLKGLDDIEKICNKANFEDLTNKQLAVIYNKAWKNLSLPNPAMLQALYYALYLNEFFKEKLLEVLTEKEKNNEVLVNNIHSLLLTHMDLSITDEEEIALYNLKKIYKDKYKEKGLSSFLNDPIINKKIKKLAKNFGWFHMEYASDPFTAEDYKKHLKKTLKDSKKYKSPIEIKKKVKKKKEIFFVQHKNSQYLKSLVKVLEKFSFVLDHSKATVVRGFSVCLPLFKEVAKRLDVKYKDSLFLVPPEIINYLTSKKQTNKGLIKKRKKARVAFLKNKQIKWYEGKKVHLFEKKYLAKEIVKKTNTIKGISVYPGKVIGKAVIVKSIKDYKRFKQGDIMVTHDGSAELTVMLKEAGAIITNEGGIICHAAIVARESETPCIVGTKIATKVIKDGSKVEVDANKGIIKIIN